MQSEGSTVRGDAQVLAELRRRFASFRRTSRPGAWVPMALRDSVLAAIAHGIPAARVQAACGITSGQLSYWKRSSKRGSSRRSSDDDGTRVFSVVDERHKSTPMGTKLSEETLRLRIGSWSVDIAMQSEGQ